MRLPRMATTVLPRPWDSTFFGARIFEAHLSDDRVDYVVDEAVAAAAECLYLFIDAGDLAAIDTAVRRAARLVDLRVELGGRIDPDPDATAAAAPTRTATHADRDILMPQARELAVESRFARDRRIPEEKVGEMYEIWLDRCLDEGVVAVPVSSGAGFVGARTNGGVAQIELVYVDAASRGQGLGRALIRAAVSGLAASDATVVTQIGNVAAQRLYQSMGLRSRRTLAVLHLWLDERSL
jgi:ribosomal protein S18 acetylase RimI-like enzyme